MREANRFALTGRLDKAYAVLPDDVRYQQMRRLYEQGPRYVQALVDIYRDNPKVLELLALLRLSGPGGLQATAPIYQRILKLDPKNINALTTLGAICINANLLSQAENYLTLAVQSAAGLRYRSLQPRPRLLSHRPAATGRPSFTLLS